MTSGREVIAAAVRVDSHGFPIETCGRCNGSGRFPSSAWNGVCLDCSGTSVVYAGTTVARLAAEYVAAVRTATHCNPAHTATYGEDDARTDHVGVHPGEQIRRGPPDPWRQVAATESTGEVRGLARVGIGENQRLVSQTFETVVTFTDGQQETVHGEQWQRLPDLEALNALHARLVSEAVTSHEKLVVSRHRDAERAAYRLEAATAAAAAGRERLLAEHPDLVWLTYQDVLSCLGGEFLDNCSSALNRGTMSDRQITAALTALRTAFDREDARAQQIATGNGVPAGRVEIVGEVATTRVQDSRYGPGSVFKLLVVTDAGWKVWGTAPAKLVDAAGSLKALKGKRITMVATTKPSDNDPLFGYFSSPSRVSLHEAGPDRGVRTRAGLTPRRKP